MDGLFNWDFPNFFSDLQKNDKQSFYENLLGGK